MIQASSDVFYISSLDDRVRPKRFYLAPGETSYRVEAIHEHDGGETIDACRSPTWRLGRVASADEATSNLHMAHVERAYAIPAWETRPDVPAWMRNIALVTTLHGQHYTGYMFNDYAKMLETLRWMATQIPARARARVHLGVGRPVLLGLSDLSRERSDGRRGRLHEARQTKDRRWASRSCRCSA